MIPLSDSSAKEINNLLAGKNVYAASISGFSDAFGSELTNMNLSRDRVNGVKRIMESMHIG